MRKHLGDSINGCMLCYVFFALTIVLSDYLQVLLSVEYIYSVLGAGVILGGFFLYFFKKYNLHVYGYKVCVGDIFVILFIGILGFLRGTMPDSCFDTSNYHLYFQQFLNRDFVNTHFFPVRAVNASTLVLGDRMFYFFRYILGYRMGTMLSVLIVILIYFQLKHIIKIYLKIGVSEKKLNNIIAIMGILCLLTENIITLLSTYMIDLLFIPFLLEIIEIVLLHEENERQSMGITIIYLCTLLGIATAIKMTNAMVVFPVAVLFIIKNRKKIKVVHYLEGFACIITILLIYLYCSYVITGNPVFPYMNALFKSEYFSTQLSPNDFSAFNVNFGPRNLIEYVFWPVFMLVYPERTSDIPFCTGRLFLIVIGMVIYFGYKLVNKEKLSQREKEFAIIFLSLYFLYLFVFRGYMRYMIVLELLGSAALCCIIFRAYISGNALKISIMSMIFCLTIEQVMWMSKQCIYGHWEWSWRDIKNTEALLENAKKNFKDYSSGIDKDILDQIESLLVVDASGSLAVNLKADVPIINLTSSVTNETTEKMLEERIEQLSLSGIYSLNKKEDFLSNVTLYASYGFMLKDILLISPDFYNARFQMPLVELEKTDEEIVVEVLDTSQKEILWEIPEGTEQIEVFFGDYVFEEKWHDDPYYLSVGIVNSQTGEEQILCRETVQQKDNAFDRVTIGITDQTCEFDSIRVWKENKETDAEGEQYIVIFQYSVND